MKKYILFAALAILISLFGCTKTGQMVSDDLRLRHKDADMPIWVRGNMESRKIVRFENSWHAAFHTESAQFARELLRFVHTH